MSAAAPLRILHTESSLGWGGQEIRVLTEARGVARRGHEVLLAAPADSRIHAEALALRDASRCRCRSGARACAGSPRCAGSSPGAASTS